MLITHVRVFKPELVTAIFRANDIITDNEEVLKLAQLGATETPDGMRYAFAVQYKDFRTQRHAPDHITLKLITEQSDTAKRELDFYQRIAPVMKRRVDEAFLRFPQCYDVYQDEASHRAHLLLDDFTHEYKPSADKAPPSARHREQIMDTLAYFHAFWWEHPLIEELGELPGEDSIATTLGLYQAKFNELQSVVGNYLDDKYVSVLQMIANSLPEKRKDALLAGKNLTLIHNDLHPDNLVYSPRESYIINWQHWTISLATDDLATMIPFYWSDHLRQFQEKPLLKRYFSTLLKQGVADYTWDDLEYDYKVSLSQVIGGMLANWTRAGHTSGEWRIIEAAIDSFLEMDGISIFN